jgi:hypothetical protein
MLALFLAFVGAMGYLTAYGFKNGQVEKLIAPYDGNLDFCGFDKNAEFKYLYLVKISDLNVQNAFKSGVCVKSCPQKDEALVAQNTPDQPDANGFKSPYNTKAVLGYCLPASTADLPQEIKAGYANAKAALMSNPIGKYFNDMYLSSRAIYASFGMGVVYCLVYIYLMSWFAEYIAWICVILLQLGLIGLPIVGWFMRAAEVENYNQNQAIWD